MGVGEIISERIKGEKYSCEGLWVSIPDGISEKESSGKTFSILLPDLIKKFSLDLEFWSELSEQNVEGAGTTQVGSASQRERR